MKEAVFVARINQLIRVELYLLVKNMYRFEYTNEDEEHAYQHSRQYDPVFLNETLKYSKHIYELICI